MSTPSDQKLIGADYVHPCGCISRGWDELVLCPEGQALHDAMPRNSRGYFPCSPQREAYIAHLKDTPCFFCKRCRLPGHHEADFGGVGHDDEHCGMEWICRGCWEAIGREKGWREGKLREHGPDAGSE